MNDVQEVQVSLLHERNGGSKYRLDMLSGMQFCSSMPNTVFKYFRQKALFTGLLLFIPFSIQAELSPVSDHELAQSMARANFPVPLLDQVGFNLSAAGIEIDLDIQADIESIEWIDEDGIGTEGSEGTLMLKGVHIGGFDGDITQKMVRSDRPFASTDLAMIRGMLVQADPEAGTLITINQLGSEPGQGIDIIVNDIYFGQDLSAGIETENLMPEHRGWGLLLEDISNFASDDYVQQINGLFGLQLSTLDDGFNSLGGNYYPLQVSMVPLEVPDTRDLGSELIPGINLDTSMRIDAQFMLHMKKLAVYKQMDNGPDGKTREWEMGIEGLMLYQGLDTNNDGIEDTIGPATMGMTMQTIPHQLSDGSTVQAMHFSDINLNTDIAMANVYIGNAETGSLGAIHIDNLQIIDTQMWIYPH